MAILAILKNAGTVVLAAAKSNPIAAAGIAVGTGATIGGAVYWNRRRKTAQALKAVDSVDIPAVVEAALAQTAADLATAPAVDEKDQAKA